MKLVFKKEDCVYTKIFKLREKYRSASFEDLYPNKMEVIKKDLDNLGQKETAIINGFYRNHTRMKKTTHDILMDYAYKMWSVDYTEPWMDPEIEFLP